MSAIGPLDLGQTARMRKWIRTSTTWITIGRDTEMGINAEAYRFGQAARRDHLTDQYTAALAAAQTGDTFAQNWIRGWLATTRNDA